MNDAWMAGIFEGEGCISSTGGGRRPELYLEMSDKDIIDRFHKIVGVGNKSQRQRGNYKPTYIWRTGKMDAVVNILERMLPFLGERRACKALDTFDFYDGCNNCTPPEPIALG